MSCYLFGAVWAPVDGWEGEEIEILGQKGEVRLVREGDLGFLFSELGIDGKLKATRKAAKQHSQILTDLLTVQETLAPVPFGTVIESEQEIREMLDRNRDQIENVLDNIDNQVEYGIKVYWDPDEVARRLAEESDEIQELKSKIKRGGVGNTFEATLEVGELIEEKMGDKKEDLKQDVLKSLKDVINDWVVNEPFDERMAANLAFLLDKEDQDELDRTIEDLGKSEPDYLTINYSGPWPPFNFVNLELR